VGQWNGIKLEGCENCLSLERYIQYLPGKTLSEHEHEHEAGVLNQELSTDLRGKK
jgi:hypothetical protein